ncbi:MAG: glycosyltransferase [Bacteroidota bacterium]
MDQPLEEKYLTIAQKQLRKPRVLVAPLDWGLGHATRCIPIIKELLRQDCEVWLAGEGAQEILLKKEFPHLTFLQLQGYRIRYAKSAIGLIKNILFQTPKILKIIKYENDWLKRMVKEHGFDAVISDNRYGLYHPEVHGIFITHQLTIKNPLGKWTEKILQNRNYRYINYYTECWIPDEEGKNNFAGVLSHPQKKPGIPIHYIGLLSRFDRTNVTEQKGRLLLLLSGPEPQRSILENKIIKGITDHNGYATIVRGLPGEETLVPSTNMIKFFNHLPAEELNNEMMKAEYIIARSGYSSIMDIVTLQKKSILIPTPGQTEQQYLAGYLMKQQIALSLSQKEFTLTDSLHKARRFTYQFYSIENKEQKLQQVISTLIKQIKR